MKKHFGIIEHLEIIDIADEGKSVARYNDLVVFVTGAVPGDIVDVRVTRSKRNFIEAKVVNIHKPSADRILPFCKHFGICGGCKWQYLGYEKQLEYKQKQVSDCLQRIAKINIEGKLMPVKPSVKTTFYRTNLNTHSPVIAGLQMMICNILKKEEI